MRASAVLAGLLSIGVLAAGPSVSWAQPEAYPSRPITAIVPFPAGGPSDVVARIALDQMGRILGQSIVIENIGGAGGTIGSGRAAAAAPDGYTLLAGSMGSHVAAPVLTPNLRYDPARDFDAIGPTAYSPAVIAARRDFPAKNIGEFITYVREHGPEVKEAHGGIGASSHMACLLFTSELGLKPTLVAYRGTGPAVNDLVGGHVDFLCEQSVSVAEQIASGTVKGYLVAGSERLATMPEIPSAKEAGIDYDMNIWAGIFAPKGTPPEIIAKLSDALDQALDDPGVRKRLADLGASLPAKAARKPAKFESMVKAEMARWAPILKAAVGASTN